MGHHRLINGYPTGHRSRGLLQPNVRVSSPATAEWPLSETISIDRPQLSPEDIKKLKAAQQTAAKAKE